MERDCRVVAKTSWRREDLPPYSLALHGITQAAYTSAGRKRRAHHAKRPSLQEHHPVRLPVRWVEEVYPEKARLGAPVPDLRPPLEVARQLTPDLDPVHVLSLGIQDREKRLLEHARTDAYPERQQEDRQAHTVETDARGLKGGELVLTAQG